MDYVRRALVARGASHCGYPRCVAGGNDNPTDDQPVLRLGRPERAPTPGLVVAFVQGAPHYEAIVIPKGRVFTIGRSPRCDVIVEDGGVSREHLAASHDGAVWRFRDLGANNGSFVDGARIAGDVAASDPKCVRLGRSTVLVPVDDVAPYLERGVRIEAGLVLGPLVGAAYAKLEQWGAAGHPVLIRGETGTGKHDAAACYARACRRPMNAINVALATANLAPSTLFGAKKGAYSGADADRDGWFGGAHGKVLFLDEIGELPLEVQAMLLHAVETGEIVPVGATASRKVDVRVVAATHVDLEAAVRGGKFRSDLLARLEKRSVVLPPLRERLSDVPHMIAASIAKEAAKQGREALPASGMLVEACMLYAWPRNMRQLDTAIGQALEDAWADRAGPRELGVEHCPEVDVREVGGAAAGVGEGARLEALKAAYARRGSVRGAAEEVGMARSTAHAWLRGAGVI